MPASAPPIKPPPPPPDAPNDPGLSSVVHKNIASLTAVRPNNAPRPARSELDEIKRDVNPEKVARQIERAETNPNSPEPPNKARSQ